MKGAINGGYLDGKSVEQEEELIRVKLLQPIINSPIPLQDNQGQPLSRGSVLSLPLWLAVPLINASVVVPMLPKAYSPTARQAILAGPRSVSVPSLGRKCFYGPGARRCAQWWPGLQLPELLYDTFRGRLELMYAHPTTTSSTNHRGYTTSTGDSPITDRLDPEELIVYKSCVEQRRRFEDWLNAN